MGEKKLQSCYKNSIPTSRLFISQSNLHVPVFSLDNHHVSSRSKQVNDEITIGLLSHPWLTLKIIISFHCCRKSTVNWKHFFCLNVSLKAWNCLCDYMKVEGVQQVKWKLFTGYSTRTPKVKPVFSGSSHKVHRDPHTAVATDLHEKVLVNYLKESYLINTGERYLTAGTIWSTGFYRSPLFMRTTVRDGRERGSKAIIGQQHG